MYILNWNHCSILITVLLLGWQGVPYEMYFTQIYIHSNGGPCLCMLEFTLMSGHFPTRALFSYLWCIVDAFSKYIGQLRPRLYYTVCTTIVKKEFLYTLKSHAVHPISWYIFETVIQDHSQFKRKKWKSLIKILSIFLNPPLTSRCYGNPWFSLITNLKQSISYHPLS